MVRHGGQILVDHLKAQGVRRVFSVPGESFLAALDGLYDSGIQNVVCRQEGGAAMMAEAHGKLTGTPGVLFVTRGPGATNASSGIHVARQDSTPMIVFVGQIARGHRDREAFQELDYRAFYGPLAKWVAEVDQIERLPEYLSRAFHVAKSGRPGPVVLALPEDMLSSLADVSDIPPAAEPVSEASQGQATAVATALEGAKRPLIVAGGPLWTAEVADTLARFATAFDLPVTVSFRRQDYLDNRHPNYVGDLNVGMSPTLAKRLKQADCLLVLGSRLGDIATGGYELVNPADPDKKIIHVHADPDELGRVFRPDLGIAVSAPAMLGELARLNGPANPVWGKWRADLKAEFDAWQVPRETPGTMKLENVVTWLAANLPSDAIIANGAGNYNTWLHRYFSFRAAKTYLGATCGSMGYSLPGAIAASLEHPDRTVICWAGDGCFQMTCNEFSTAMQYGAKPIVIVVNNGRYGTIRMHQERKFPGRVSGTDMANPDFAAWARAYGGFGIVVEDDADFADAFAQAKAAGSAALIELRQDPEALAPGMTLSEARALGRG